MNHQYLFNYISDNAALTEPPFEKGGCGVGFVGNINGTPSADIVMNALKVLCNLEHRGAAGAVAETGDGAGILLATPDVFMRTAADEQGLSLPPAGKYAVAMVFLPQNPTLCATATAIMERAITDSELRVIGWRDVPIVTMHIGTSAATTMPNIRQCFITTDNELSGDAFERRLFVARKRAENAWRSSEALTRVFQERDDFYICSISAKTVVYKGLLHSSQLERFFPDLTAASMQSTFAIVHSRFGTNTLGAWKLAHPYRMLAHNGEINTLRGNRNWMTARESTMESPLFGEDIKHLKPVCERDASDSSSLDNVFELLLLSGRPLGLTAAMIMPPAWYSHRTMSRAQKDFHDYYSGIMEPWDGPAMIIFTDGQRVGVSLDRNGFRPFRYTITKTNMLIMGSETGTLPIPPEDIVVTSRVAPGRNFMVDFEQQRVLTHEDIVAQNVSRAPYGEWLHSNRLSLDEVAIPDSDGLQDTPRLQQQQRAFGYTREDLTILIEVMAASGYQPLGSMGNDAPPAVLSDRPQLLFSYFRQLFAQVSNPPLDSIRERLVTQMAVPIGRRANLLSETAEHAALLWLGHPVLTNRDLAKLKTLQPNKFKVITISTLFNVAEGGRGLRRALDRIRKEADIAVNNGAGILILSDRGVNSKQTYVPSLLAVGAVHHYLIRSQRKTLTDIVVESGEPREVHHFATLFGYGATAINPFLALDSTRALYALTESDNIPSTEELEQAEQNYITAVEDGVRKTMAKMGISTLQGYIGAQQFEALGLAKQLVDEYFTWTASRIGGIGLDELAEDLLTNHRQAFSGIGDSTPEPSGLYHWRSNGEQHGWHPNVIALLQHASKQNRWETYQEFERQADSETTQHLTIRGLLRFKQNLPSIPLDGVEPVADIVKRFATGAISLGSISRETHEALAIAMNRIGAKSNTGEGGEDSRRFSTQSDGDSSNSAIKQVASGRFGVTVNYLANASDLQIKMAQGAKPGEGGEIPGDKISEYIANIRKTTPGVGLISPPPHHDIYSIEDLAQLIHDLKNVNPLARIHVKLVSEVGVGIIAAGVAKGKADVVLISGGSGGTGASPLSSIKHGGLPWELGVAETHQVLVANGLRSRIVVQTDGQIKTGRDVVIAALLGAEEWGVATAALVTLGCVMLRKCHLNTCSVGIATQDPELRKKFSGTPEAVMHYFMMLAESVRGHMAQLGFRTVNEMIGRVDCLEQRRDITHFKAKKLDLARLLTPAKVMADDHSYQCIQQDHHLDKTLDNRILPAAKRAIAGKQITIEQPIKNTHRSVGAMLSGFIAKHCGDEGLTRGSLRVGFKGYAGQSFGAFVTTGVEFTLEGEANDYFGKGLSGGRLIVIPPATATYQPENNVAIGNVALYGATGGEAYVRGCAGERFAVRNSAAIAVIEGVGDHCCEYMTGGRVCVLGPTGRNFASGMTGGVTYVLDSNDNFATHLHNDNTSDLLPLLPASENAIELQGMLRNHLTYTGSTLAQKILMNWDTYVLKFSVVMPRDYARVLKAKEATPSYG